MSAPVRSAPLPSIGDRRPTLYDRPNIAARHTPNDHLRGVRDAFHDERALLIAADAHNGNGFHPATTRGTHRRKCKRYSFTR